MCVGWIAHPPPLPPGIHSWLLRHWSGTRVAEFSPDGEPITMSPSAFRYLRYLLWGTRPAWQKPIWTIWKLPPPGIIVDSSGSSRSLPRSASVCV